MMEQKPYLEKTVIVREYNPEYGDDRVCKCGHMYHRHFDSYDRMSNVGCKYCACFNFEERKPLIDSFTGHYRWLSNFWSCIVKYDGIYYNSVEAAYQASKFEDQEIRKLISEMNPGDAKRYGRNAKVTNAWISCRLDIMERLLKRKFAPDSVLAESLDNTGDIPIVEGNTWKDVYWGVCDGVGENHLGKLLMKIRRENRERKNPIT